MRQIYSPLDGFRSPFGRLMGSTAPFTPAGLFALAEPGVWYDPSDVANLAWRRNLLTFTEQFDNAAWTKTRTTISANAITAPDGTSTADKLVEDTSTNDHWVGLGPDGVAGAAYTASVFAKAGERGFVALSWVFESPTFFNLTTGAIGTQNPNYTASIVPLSDGWFRCSITRTAVSTSDFLKISVRNADGVASYTGDGTSGIYIWGAQFEAGSLTDYQRISDVNTEVIERFPSATLYQDTAGTTPVTTPGQTVALALDKSKGLVLGSELVTNGTFDSGTTGWVAGFGLVNGTFTASGGIATLTQGSSDTSPRFVTTLTGLTVGNSYRLNFTSVSQSGAGDKYVVWTNSSNGTGGTTLNQGGALNWGGQSRTFLVTATATTMYVAVGLVSAATGASVTIDNISVKELPGFHATQATLASRPTYGIVPLGGRRNLLTRTEEFGDAAWATTEGTIVANTAIAPNGTTTADKLREASGAISFGPRTGQNFSFVTGTTYTLSLYIKPDGRDWARLELPASAFGSTTFAWVNASTGAVGTTANSPTVSVLSVGSGWYRVSVSKAATSTTTGFPTVRIGPSDGTISYTGDGTSGILLWGAQLETGSSASAYQRVGSAFDVTEAGVASLSYLSFDGVDDFLITPTITPGIDRAQVFAGVRKLSDATAGIIVESSATVETNNGSVIAFTNPNTYGAKLRGSLNPSAVTAPTSYAVPITNVLTAIGDIAGDLNTLRINGTQQATASSDQGTGNFLAYPLYIGRRNGATLPLNGQLYSLIVRFGTNLDAGTITSTETWVNSKTGAYT